MLLLAVDYIGWKTRWVSPTDTLIAQDDLTKWSGNLARKLMSGCCNDQETLHRVTTDGEMEISTDGGETWQPDPNDPRKTGTQLPNTIPGTGSDKKCNAATNAVDNFKDAQAAFGVSIDEAGTVVGLALAIAAELLLLVLSVGTAAEVLVPLLISTAVALFGLVVVDYNAEFTEAVWSQLTCDLFCTIGSDGQFNAAQLINLQARLDSDFSGNVALTFSGILTGWGLVGLNNACITGVAATADCSDCDCSLECALATQDWEIGTVTSTDTDPDTGITTVVVESEFISMTNSVRWGTFADSAPDGCVCIGFTPDPSFCDDWYYRYPGEADSTIHGPVTHDAFEAAVDATCVNLLQVNCGNAFTMTAIFQRC